MRTRKPKPPSPTPAAGHPPRRLPRASDRDRIAAATYAADKLLDTMRRLAPAWQHHYDSSGQVTSEAR